jgi:DNA-binding LacI/PurR family transcriptional regulator
VSVPGELSVVGFDNSVPAGGAGLTSFDHNLEALARVILDFVLGGTLWRRAHGQRGDIEVEGAVVERGSSGRLVARG